MVSRITLFAALFALCIAPGMMSAQHTPHPGCGITAEDQELIKERMFENRRNRAALEAEWEAIKSTRTVNDSTLWVPTVFHMCSRANGAGQQDDAWVLSQMCNLNAGFADQNIQFYLVNVNRFNSDQLYYNKPASADYIRSIHKVTGAMNIFVGGAASDPLSNGSFGAYYAPGFDWIFSWNDQPLSSTVHEVGHLLTLPHTFNGWEGTDYATESAATGYAPVMGTNGKPVEKVARGTAAENCQWAADGFCDTPPDYSSGGGSCSGTVNYSDPDNVPFVLDNSIKLNYMSYFFCNPKVFSANQKTAMLLDALSRGYQYVAEPIPLMVDGAPAINWPNSGAVAHYVSTPVELKWDPAPAAGGYLVTVERTINNGSIVVSTVTKRTVFNATSLWITLQPNLEYTWKVKALTRYDLCSAGGESPKATFTTAGWALSTDLVTDIESSRVYPNPASQGKQVFVEVNVPFGGEAQISIQNTLGQTLMSKQNLSFVSGINMQQLDLSSLTAGMYIVTIETANQRISHKLMIQD